MESAKHIIESYAGRKLRVMEVCGTHTHEIFRLGIRRILPPQIELISGPGCPVCVTPAGYIERKIDLRSGADCYFHELFIPFRGISGSADIGQINTLMEDKMREFEAMLARVAQRNRRLSYE